MGRSGLIRLVVVLALVGEALPSSVVAAPSAQVAEASTPVPLLGDSAVAGVRRLAPASVPPVRAVVRPGVSAAAREDGLPVEVDLEQGVWTEVEGTALRLRIGAGDMRRDRGLPEVANAHAVQHATVSVAAVGSDRGRALGLDAAAFEIGASDVSTVIEGELDYSMLVGGYSMDWPYRLQFDLGGDCGGCDEVVFENDPEHSLMRFEIVSGGPHGAASASEAAIASNSTENPLVGIGRRPATSRSGLRSTSAAGSGGSVYGLTSGFASDFGSYQSTPLLSSAGWAVGLNSGSFDWSYALPAVPSGWGAAPGLSLSYSSQQLDGLAPDMNAQAGSFGFGWSLSQGGFIERSYQTCSNLPANPITGVEDLCWFTDVAGSYESLTFVVSGRSVPLVPVAWDPQNPSVATEWRLQGDPLVRVRRFTGALGSPDSDGEWFEATMADGTRSLFGSAPDRLDSAWAVPVFAPTVGQPCFNAQFSLSYCQQGWRFNLDQVIDPNGNVTEYDYQSETNRYRSRGADISGQRSLTYQRAGILEAVRYGLNPSAGATSPHARHAMTIKDRCAANPIGNCAWLGTTSTPSYVDSPTDLECSDTQTPTTCTKDAPSFFSKKVVTDVTTGWSSSGSTWTTVDSIHFETTWVDPQPANPAAPDQLWLSQIQRTGYSGTGGSISLPPVLIANAPDSLKDNRYGSVIVRYYRVDSITDELGARVEPTYTQPFGCTGQPATSWVDNTQNCFPRWVMVTPTDQGFGVFNNYVVTRVDVVDTTGISPTVVQQYDYLDPPAWHHDDSPTAHPTWSDYRGFGRVRVISGASPEVRMATEHLFFRGMHGDSTGNGGTRTVTFADSKGANLTDHGYLRGLEYETRALLDPAGASVQSYTYTGYLAMNPLTPASTMVRVANTITDTYSSATSSFLRTQQQATYDSLGRTETVTELGDVNVSTDNLCSVTTYAAINEPAWILDRPSSVESRSGSCAGTLTGLAEYAYDNGAIGAAPTKGLVTLARSSDGGTLSAVSTTYDLAGRVLAVDGPLSSTPNDVTTYTYDATSGLSDTTTNPLGHVTNVDIDPARGLTTSVTDANGKVTTIAYDSLGREIARWLPGDPTSGAASVQVSYNVSQTSPSSTMTSVWQSGGTRLDSWAFVDGSGRLIQTQRPTPQGDATVASSVVFDTAGRTVRVVRDHTAAATPGVGFLAVPSSPIRENRLDYDGIGRLVADASFGNATVLFSSQYSYDGWTSTGLLPHGTSTTPSRKVVETRGGRGELQRRDEYLTASTYRSTQYTYDAVGNLTGITDDANRVTTMTYDWLGRQTSMTDPNRGLATSTYDQAGNLITATNPAGATWHKYDALSRLVERRANNASGTLLAAWTYDNTSTTPTERGLLDYRIAYNNGATYRTDVIGYDARNRPTGTSYVIPSDPGWTNNGLAGTYSFPLSYDKADHVTGLTYPAVGNHASETTTTTYNAQGFATGLTGLTDYLVNGTYTAAGLPATRQLGTSSITNYTATQTLTWDPATGRLTRIQAAKVKNGASTPIIDDTYTYDTAGIVINVNDAISPRNQRQCFAYDPLERLISAYTNASGIACSAGTPDTTGPAPYNEAYTYDTTDRISSFGPANPTRTAGLNSYAYTAPATPHAPSTITRPASTVSYTYDSVGNRATSTDSAGTDYAYTWDSKGRLLSTASVEAPQHKATLTATNAAGATSLTLTRPTGTAAGDTLIAAVVTPPTPSSSTYEAETATRSNVVVEALNCPCSGGSAIGGFEPTATSEYVEFSVTAASAGMHDLTFTYSTGQVDATRRVTVNGTTLVNRSMYFPRTPGSTAWQTETIRTQLSSGTNLVRIASSPTDGSYGLLQLDKLTVSPRSVGATVYEGENATVFGHNIVTNGPPASNMGWVGAPATQLNPYVQFTVTAASAGNHDIVVSYGSGFSSGAYQNAWRNVRLNNTVVITNQSFPAGGNFDVYPGIQFNKQTLTLNLKNGSNTIRFEPTASGGGLMTWDKITVIPATVNDAPTVTAPSGWDKIAESTTTGTRTSVFARTTSDADPATWDFSISTKTKATGLISDYTAAAIEATNTGINSSSTNHSHPSVTSGGTQRTLVTIAGIATATTVTPAAGMTERGEQAANTGPPTVTIETASQPITSAGATGTRTATSANAAASATISLLLKPPTAANLYDVDRTRLVHKAADGTITLYLGGLMEITRTPAGRMETRRTYAVDETPIAVRSTRTTSPLDTETAYLTTDRNGSLRAALVNDATGSVAILAYTPYGIPRTATALGNRGYLDAPHDPMTGLIYLNNRHMDPTIGVFLSVDPLVQSTGEPYLYAGGNPTTLSDPSGLCTTFERDSASGDWICSFYSSDGHAVHVGNKGDPQGNCGLQGCMYGNEVRYEKDEYEGAYDHGDGLISLKTAVTFIPGYSCTQMGAPGIQWGAAIGCGLDIGTLGLAARATLVGRAGAGAAGGALESGATEAVRPGASFSQLYDGGGGVIAQVDDAGVLNLAIEAGPATPRGGQMFNQALSEVGPVNGIRGTWNPSMPSNLDAFNANIRAGMSAEEAARATFTGTMAGRAGFTNLTIEQLTGTPGAYTNVKVVFGG